MELAVFTHELHAAEMFRVGASRASVIGSDLRAEACRVEPLLAVEAAGGSKQQRRLILRVARQLIDRRRVRKYDRVTGRIFDEELDRPSIDFDRQKTLKVS